MATTTEDRRFKKGQRVFYIRTWNEKGKFVVSVLNVYSCGAKQMVLVDDRGEKFAGTNFLPGREQYPIYGGTTSTFSTVETGITLEQAVEIARERAVQFKAYAIEDCRKKISVWGQGPENSGYREAMERKIAEIEADPIGVEVRS